MAVNDEYGPSGVAATAVPSIEVPTLGPVGLQGWAAASGDVNDYINRTPDPRLNSILRKTGSPLRLGIIQQTDDWAIANDQRQPYACRFMFNPPVINVGYSIATGVLPANQLTSAQAAALALYPGQTTLGFSLLFDRTYEVAYGPGQSNPTDLRKIGVYHDIHALENVVGVSNSANYTRDSVDEKGKAKTNANALLGNMLMVPVYVIFGGGAGIGLAFVGFFTAMSVTYTLFSQNMVPTRAAVDLQFNQLIGSNAQDFQQGGGTLLERIHNFPRSGNTTSSGKALPGRSVANSQ